MPILKREPDLFPANIFELSEPWWVAHLRSRQEKLFARHLAQRGIAYYLPQAEKRVRRSNRTFTSYIPLFPGYVFFRGEKADTAVALRTNVVVKILTPYDQATIQDELRQIHDLQLLNGRLTPHPHLHTGDAVVITEGVFAGFRGVIIKERSTERLVVSVSFIRQSVSVEIDREAIRPQRASDASRRVS